MKKLYCINCSKKVAYNETKEIKSYDYKGVNVEIEEVIKKCAICNEELYDEEQEGVIFDKIYNKYLEQFNLSFDQFKVIRERYGLSQELFAKLMNWSKKTIVRYENKQSLPQKEYLEKYMELNNNKNKIYELLSFAKIYLEEDDYNKILKILEKKGYYKSKRDKLKNTILYLLNSKELYTTQLMKHLFAVDFLFFKEYEKSITGYQYARLQHGPVLDGYKKIINDFIDTGVIKTKIVEIEKQNDNTIFQLKAGCKCDTTIFNSKELAILDNVLKHFNKKSSNQLSDWSHKFVGWKETGDNKIISYEYAKYLSLD